MRYFKDGDDNIFAYEDRQVKLEHVEGLQEITELEVKSFRLFGVWDQTEAKIKAKEQEIEAQEKVSIAHQSLQALCDTKSKQAKAYIAGREVTDEQARRYEEKYQIAKEYKATGAYGDKLELEAGLQGLTVDELADIIINMGETYKEELITFNAKIEAVRTKISKMIEEGKVDKAMHVIEQAKVLGPGTTDEQIKALF